MFKESKPIATALDIRKFAESRQWEESARVVLPKSGFPVILRRPTRFYRMLRRASWPVELQEKLDLLAGGDETIGLSKSEALFYLQEQDRMIVDSFVEPKPSLTPDCTQFDPRWLPEEDREFIKAYLGGQVLADGSPLDSFSGGKPRDTEGGGDSGQDVRAATDRDTGTAGAGMADQLPGGVLGNGRN